MNQDDPDSREPPAGRNLLRIRSAPPDVGDVSDAPATNRWAPRWRWAVAPLVAIIFLTSFGVVFVRKGERSEWHTCYMQAARRLVAGQVINRSEPNAYAYPPAMAMLCAPLAGLPAGASTLVWYAVNAVAVIVVWAGAWRLMGGPSLARLDGKWLGIFGLGALLSFRFVAAPLETQQFDLVIVALLTCGWLAWQRGGAWSAAVWWGVAAAMKCTPLLFAPYLVWRGRLKPALMLILVAVAMNRLPDAIWPRASGLYVSDWAERFLFKVGRAAPGVWDSDLQLNQSLSGMFNRFIQAGAPLSTDSMPSGLAQLSPEVTRQIRYWTYGASLLLVALTAWRIKRAARPQRLDGTDGGQRDSDPAGAPRAAIECAAIACLMLLLSPMSSKAHYVVLVLPALIIARAVVERWSQTFLWLLPLLLLTGPLTSKGLIGKSLGDLTLVWGWPTFFAIFLLVGMWRAMSLNRLPSPAQAPQRQNRAAA